MAYADYVFYTNEYKGKSIPENAFEELAAKAGFFIDSITFNRIGEDDVPDKVKMASCAVAEEIHKQNEDKRVSSEKIGNYSVTYTTDSWKPEKKMYNAAALHLANTGLMYRGQP